MVSFWDPLQAQPRDCFPIPFSDFVDNWFLVYQLFSPDSSQGELSISESRLTHHLWLFSYPCRALSVSVFCQVHFYVFFKLSSLFFLSADPYDLSPGIQTSLLSGLHPFLLCPLKWQPFENMNLITWLLCSATKHSVHFVFLGSSKSDHNQSFYFHYHNSQSFYALIILIYLQFPVPLQISFPHILYLKKPLIHSWQARKILTPLWSLPQCSSKA